MLKAFCIWSLLALTSMDGALGQILNADQRFVVAIKKVLENEGGLANNNYDNGNITNYGISLRYLKTLGKEGDINKDGRIDKQDIYLLTKFAAANIYKKQFWDKYGLYRINNLQLATKILDLSINMGINQLIVLLKRAILKIDPNFIAPKDIPFIICYVNKYPPFILLNALIKQAKYFYTNLVNKRPQDQIFLKGWLKRADDISIDS